MQFQQLDPKPITVLDEDDGPKNAAGVHFRVYDVWGIDHACTLARRPFQARQEANARQEVIGAVVEHLNCMIICLMHACSCHVCTHA